MARWEFWEKREATGGRSTFFCADDGDADGRRQWLQAAGMALTWTTDAASRREAERALWEARGQGGGAVPRPQVRYSPRVLRVQQSAQEEALALHHDFLAPEHYVLGLIREGEGAAAEVLDRFGVALHAARDQVASSLAPSPFRRGSSSLTPGAVAAREAADTYAEEAGLDAIETDHLLLGLIEEPDAPAARLLAGLGINCGVVRDALLGQLPDTPREVEPGPDPKVRPLSTSLLARLLGWLRRRSPVRPLLFRLRTRRGVTTESMDNWAPVNVRYINRNRLLGTLNGEPVDVRLKVRGTRPRLSGTLGAHRVDAKTRISRASLLEVSVTGLADGEPIALSATLHPADLTQSYGSVLSGGQIDGDLGDRHVRLEAMQVRTFGTTPSFAAGFKGSLGDHESSVMVSLTPRATSVFIGSVHGKIDGKDVDLIIGRHPRTAHVYGVCEAPSVVVLAIVSTALRFV